MEIYVMTMVMYMYTQVLRGLKRREGEIGFG